MCQKHYIIPIFIPQLACPFQCIYCNQRNISGHLKAPSTKDIILIIAQYFKTIPKIDSQTEVAFFGGNFTGLPLPEQEQFLKTVQPYLENGSIQNIRLSTRPDYINKDILELLKRYHVNTIELGAQSMDNDVLRLSGRGHTFNDIAIASKLIIEYGFSLGLQMMLGLPNDTLEKSINTAKMIIALGAENTRIYPTLVIKDTQLEKLYKENKYKPLSLEEAIEWTKETYKIFEKAEVKVLRMGLHPSMGLISGESLVAGPFHVSFGELVMTALWNDTLIPLIRKVENKSIVISVAPKQINNAIGHNAINKKMLLEYFKEVKFITNSLLKGRNYHVDYC
jgi:histone acetyltransferase (RNA polymerase elongator complex component)